MTLGVTRKDLVMVAVLLVGVLLAVLNQTFLSPALPTIMADVGVDATTAQWLTSGYALVEAVVIPLSAYLIGRFSTRQLFITAFALFTVGSLSAALAPNFWVLLLGRVLHATCTGMDMPMVFTVILLVFPREKRGTAMGVIGLIIGFAPAVGPSVAGLLVDSVGWRALFAVVTGLSVAVILLAVFVLKNYGNFTRAPFDALSVALSTVGLVCLLYGLSTFAHSENLVITFALMAFGLVVCGLYVRRQTKLPVPMLHVDILRTRKYAITVVVIVIIQAALMGCEVITPLYIQGVLGNSASVSGFAMLPGAVIGAVMGLLSGRLFDRYGLRKVVIPGIIVAVLGASGLARLGIDSPIIAVTLTYTTLAIGLQFTMTPLNTWGVNSLSNSMIHHAESVSNTLNQVAASVGTAVLVSVSAMAPGLYPEASGLEQMYLGDHMAYTTTFAIMVLAALIVIFVAREKKGAEVTVPADSLPDYSAGFDGVTVDATADERRDPASYVASDVMNRQPVVVSDADTMETVIRQMAAQETGGLPVVNGEGALVGFVTDGDVASYLGRTEISLVDSSLNIYRYADDETSVSRLRDLLALNVMAVATHRVISVKPDTPVDEVCALFASKRIKKVPVVGADGRLVGVLSRRNIMRSLADAIDRLEALES